MHRKFNNIRDLADARYAAAAMAEWVGFTVGKADSLPVGKIQEILGWCSGPKLVLEPDATISWDVLQSYLSVLPVDAVECTQEQYAQWSSHPEMQAISPIVLGDNSAVGYSHSANPGGPQHIRNVSNALDQAEQLLHEEPFAISVDCAEAESLMEKNYDTWNQFFEAIGVF